MATAISDPTALTKDKLKKELSKHEIDLPTSDAKKDVYVELYRRHVLKESEFSSDEELSPKVNRKKKPGSPKKPLSRKSSKMSNAASIDVASLSDTDLARMLKEKGVEIGPIVESTRSVYRKKLQTLLDEQEKVESTAVLATRSEEAVTDSMFSDSDHDHVDAGDMPQQQKKAPLSPRRQAHSSPARPSRSAPKVVESAVPRRMSPSRVKRETRGTPDLLPQDEHLVRRATRSASRMMEGETKTTTTTSFSATTVGSTASDSAAAAKVAAKPKRRSGLSILFQLIVFIGVALLIFFVIQNMDPAASDPTKGLGADIP